MSETQPAEGAEVPVFIIETEACKSSPRLARPQPTGRLTEDSDGGRNLYSLLLGTDAPVRGTPRASHNVRFRPIADVSGGGLSVIEG